MEAFLITVLAFFALWLVVMTVALSRADAAALRSDRYSWRRSSASSPAAATVHELAHARSHSYRQPPAEAFEVDGDVRVTADLGMGCRDVEVTDDDVVESCDPSCEMDLDDTTVFAFDDAS